MLQGVTTKRPCQLPLPWLQAHVHVPGTAWPRSRPASRSSSPAVAPMAGSAGDCWPWPWPCFHGPLCSLLLARIQGLKPGRCPHSPTPVMADGHDFGLIAMLLVKIMARCSQLTKGMADSKRSCCNLLQQHRKIPITPTCTGKITDNRSDILSQPASTCVLCRPLPATEHPALLHLSGYLSSPIKLAAPA